MSYSKNEWAKGDKITSAKMNNMEAGIFNADKAASDNAAALESLKKQVEGINAGDASAALAKATEAMNAANQANNRAGSVQTTADNASRMATEANTAATEAANAVTTMGNTMTTLSTRLKDIEDTTPNAIAQASAALAAATARLAYLEEQLKNMKKTNVVTAEWTDADINNAVSQPDADLVIDVEVPVSAVKNITAKSLDIKSLPVESGRLNLVATGDVAIANLSTSGNLPKATSNAGMSINTSEEVKIASGEWGQTGYNAVEIGLSAGSQPKNVVIDGVDFSAKMSNNCILIFDTANHATVTVSNCRFRDCSNAIRISNRSNVSMTLNVINCTFDKWEADAGYAGFLMFQDYTSPNAEAAKENNLFAPEKIKINVINCFGPNNKPLKFEVSDYPAVLGSNNADNQVAYIYTKEGLVPYVGNENRWPTISFK